MMGIRVHALRELNLTRNLEYVLGATPYLPMSEQTKYALSLLLERATILQVLVLGISHVT